ncbi:MAG: hypothetical protein M3Y43_01890 [Pseudomonadota bacterium]|nr:hypothetical protein [Pseudomonadota bacterium]MDQ2703895.1 hypothetical protein [Pseudomonadota bacterium]
MVFYIPHDHPYRPVDRDTWRTGYPSPPAYGLACDLADRIGQAIARIRTAMRDENSSIGLDKATVQPDRRLPPNRPF